MKLERAVIEVAGGCNYTCQMCPQSEGLRGKNFTKIMPLDVFKDILDQIVPKYGHPVINLEGSGEPTLVKNLPDYIKEVKKRGCKCFMYTNGSFLQGQYMEDVIDAGIDFIRLSCIGYNREKYIEWMNTDEFENLKEKAININKYISKTNSKCELSSYHLILDNANIEYEVNEYIENFIVPTNTTGYIWKMHNWSGGYQPLYVRDTGDRKTCGRPKANEITIRAGGIEKHQFGAIVPCCQTLGEPNETASVLGHLSDNTFEEIYWGEKYNELREIHDKKEFDKVSYCKNCDFLYDDPEVLVWSNDPNAKTRYMLGTNFIL